MQNSSGAIVQYRFFFGLSASVSYIVRVPPYLERSHGIAADLTSIVSLLRNAGGNWIKREPAVFATFASFSHATDAQRSAQGSRGRRSARFSRSPICCTTGWSAQIQANGTSQALDRSKGCDEIRVRCFATERAFNLAERRLSLSQRLGARSKGLLSRLCLDPWRRLHGRPII